MAQRPVTLADIVRGHVSPEIEGFDRLYFNGWVPALQTSGQIAGWLHWRGFPIASPAALGRNAQAFRAAVRRYADGNQIPWVVFRKGDRKLEVIRPYLDAAERAGQSKVVAIGEAREFQWVFDATKKDGPDGVPWFRFYRTERLVTCYYFYIHDRRMGAAFIKVCCYAPYRSKCGATGMRSPAGDPVGFQNSATGPDLGLYAARSYSLIRPPRTGRRFILSVATSATGWSGRGGRS
jgi:hypothetical protein